MHGDRTIYTIEYLDEVVKNDIPKLDIKVNNIIKRKIEKLSYEPHLGFPLRGNLAGCYKLKISKYRIVYKVYKNKLVILVIAIAKREKLEAYTIAGKRI